MRRLFLHSDFPSVVAENDWATEAEMMAYAASATSWGEQPDAFFVIMYCAAVGWVGE